MKTKQGMCYCGRLATKRKMAAWCCDRCARLESHALKFELGPVAPASAKAKYTEMDFRGRVFKS